MNPSTPPPTLRQLDPLASHQEVYAGSRRLAVIDMGSNSFRLIVVDYVPGLRFKVTDEVREAVRLSEGMAETSIMRAGAMDRALRAARIYRAFCEASGIDDIITVGTSAIREARNRETFLRRVEAESQLRLRVLSGEEEAYYGYLAAVNSTTLQNGFVLDLGGGSLEITQVAERQIHQSASLTLGAVRVTEEFLPEMPASPRDIKELRTHLRNQFESLPWFRAQSGEMLVGEGGTLRLVARLAQKMSGYPLDELHGYSLSVDQVEAVVEKLIPMRLRDRVALAGMKEDRADISLGGALVVLEAMRSAGFEQMTISSQGMREGIFYERFLGSEHSAPLFASVRQASVLNLAHLYSFQEDHAQHIAFLTQRLFEQLPSDCQLCGPAERELLWAASMLHDIGVSVDYQDHHKHGAYLILNAGLPGYTHRELALIALMTRYHRKGVPLFGELAPLMQPDDDRRLLQLSALLRLAEQLDRSRDGVVRDVQLIGGPDWLQLEMLVRGDSAVPLWAAETQRPIFEEAFGRKLEFTVTPILE